jgi:hypothetical protein
MWIAAMMSCVSLLGGYAAGYRVADDKCDGPAEIAHPTCAECEAEDECNAICQVQACTTCNQTGCWMPDDLYDQCEENVP